MTTAFLIKKNLNDQIANGPLDKVIGNLMNRIYYIKSNDHLHVDKRDIQEHLHKLTMISGQLHSIKGRFASLETELSHQANIRAHLLEFIHEFPDEYCGFEYPIPSLVQQEPSPEVDLSYPPEEEDRCKYCMNEDDGLCDITVTRRLRLYCDYYISRSVFSQSLKKLQTDGFLQIMAPHGFGKHSLLIRLDSYMKMQRNDTIFFDFFQYKLTSADTKVFFKSLCHIILNKIDPEGVNEATIDEIWASYGGVEYKFDEFIEKCLAGYHLKKLCFFFRGLATLDDEISVVLFNTLFRWNEKRKSKEKWQNVCTTIAYSPDFWYKIEKKYRNGVIINKDGQFHLESIKYRNQPVMLHGFTSREIFELANDKYELNPNEWQPEKILQIAKYLGYNPSLLNFAFYTIKKENLSPKKFYKSAPKGDGLYKSFFDKITAEVDKSILKDHMKRVLANKKIEDDKYIYFWSLGILNKDDKKYTLAELYRSYFAKELDDNILSLIKMPVVGFVLWITTSMLTFYLMNKPDEIQAYQSRIIVALFVVFVVPSLGNLFKSLKQAFYSKDIYH